jgi:uncharacterized protein (UPF0276 family)
MKPRSSDCVRPTLPADSVGVGFKPEHVEDVLSGVHTIDFFEVHAENYMGEGGPPHHMLGEIRARFPLSIHGVGLSIGSADGLDRAHLARLRRLVDRYRPDLFSEHLAWSTHDGRFLNDLLPLPYNRDTLAHICAHIDELQNWLGMRMLLENPATYVAFEASDMREVDFLGLVADRTGCGLLLDVNNVYVAATNHGFEPMAYIDAFPLERVGEIHLAGFAEDRDDENQRLLIDAHSTPVAEAVWALYRRTIARCGTVPTLIERDNDIPAFAELATEAGRAKSVLRTHVRRLQAAA